MSHEVAVFIAGAGVGIAIFSLVYHIHSCIVHREWCSMVDRMLDLIEQDLEEEEVPNEENPYLKNEMERIQGITPNPHSDV